MSMRSSSLYAGSSIAVALLCSPSPSGAQEDVLQTWSLPGTAVYYWGGVAVLDDLDGDGFPEILRGDPQASFPDIFLQSSTELQAVDGHTHEILWRLGFPSSWVRVEGGHDWNRDGFPDFFLARKELGQVDSILEVRSGAPARAATADEPRTGVRALGQPCSVVDGRNPRIGVTGLPLVGSAVQIHLGGLAPGSLAVLSAGELVRGPRSRMPGVCRAAVIPLFLFVRPVSEVAPGVGIATASVPIPADQALIGTSFHAQWLVPGLGGPAATSAVLECQLGGYRL